MIQRIKTHLSSNRKAHIVLAILIGLIIMGIGAQAQSGGYSGSGMTPANPYHPSATFDIKYPAGTANFKGGLLIPRGVLNSTTDNITTSGSTQQANGLLFFNFGSATMPKGMYYWDSTGVGSNNGKWTMIGGSQALTSGTEWYLNGISIDASSNKTDAITRSGAVNITAGDGALNLYASNSQDFTNMQFYARTATPTVRSGFIGYMNTANTRLDIGNEIGNIIMQPNNTGNVGIGTITPTAKLSVNGSANNTTGSWSVYSDARIKTIDGIFTDGLKVINKIQPVKFHYNEAAPYPTKKEQIGIIAQELEQLAPYMVTKNDYKGDEKTGTKPIKDLREVDNQAYVFLLINAVKEQQAQIDDLRLQLKQQQGTINILLNDKKPTTQKMSKSTINK